MDIYSTWLIIASLSFACHATHSWYIFSWTYIYIFYPRDIVSTSAKLSVLPPKFNFDNILQIYLFLKISCISISLLWPLFICNFISYMFSVSFLIGYCLYPSMLFCFSSIQLLFHALFFQYNYFSKCVHSPAEIGCSSLFSFEQRRAKRFIEVFHRFTFKRISSFQGLGVTN